MSLSLQKFREVLFCLLYSSDFGGEENGPLIMKQLMVTKRSVRLAEEMMAAVHAKVEEIDCLIQQKSKEYRFERIPRIERTILRLGVYEILYSPTVPPKVAISEAIRLAHKFAAPESATFINAILDAFIPHDRAPTVSLSKK